MGQRMQTDASSKTTAEPMPLGKGESAQRKAQHEKGGGKPLTDAIKDGELRGADDEGRHTTGTHGGPKKDGQPGRQGDPDRAKSPASSQRPPSDS